MPALRTYNLMISHAWKYGEDYYRLVNMLDTAPNFDWRNYSVPEDDPIHSQSERRVREALNERIRLCHAILMLGGVYASHSDWMQKEINMADGYEKPIIGLKPWGNQRMSVVVQDCAVDLVNWSTNSIVSSIRRHAL